MRHPLITTFTLASCFLAKADDKINLKNGDHFVGNVIALKDGLIELQSPHSDGPLKILNDDLVQLNFAEAPSTGQESAELPKDSQEIMLRNGDVFPGEVVGMNETHLSFQTWFTGQLEIPRDQIDSVFFGVTPQRNLYRGPRGLDSWTQGEDNQWRFADGSLTSRSKGVIGRDLKLTENFIFSANIGWQSSPNMRVHLCAKDETIGDEGVGSAFQVVINSTGVQVQRIMPTDSEGPKYKILVSHTVNLREGNAKSVQLELRVNRSTRILQLYLDGNKLEQGIDTSAPPEGSCLIFESLSAGTSDTIIKNLTIDEWDTTTQRLRLEPRAEDDLDTLSVDDGDRFSGQIISYDPNDPIKPFVVKTALSPDPIAIPLENCAVIYFSKSADNPPSKGQYHLDLRSGGGLTLSGIQLGSEKLTATHPWLGKLEIDRRAMQSISKGK